MRRLGASQADLDEARTSMLLEAKAHIEAHRPKDFEIWDENWPCWEFFRRLETQWDYLSAVNAIPCGPMGQLAISTQLRRMGLDYPGVKTQAWITGITRKTLAAWWPDIQEMEIAVLQEDAARRARRAQEG